MDLLRLDHADEGKSRLEKEEQGGNWLYTLDQISPLEI